jgi:hypothetical protein
MNMRITLNKIYVGDALELINEYKKDSLLVFEINERYTKIAKTRIKKLTLITKTK